MFGGTGLQEMLIIIALVSVLSFTGWLPRIAQGMRELRGESGDSMSQQDMDMAYKILGLSPSCTWDEIEQAYRKKAQVHHPDKGGDEDAMRVLNDVYAKLKKARRG